MLPDDSLEIPQRSRGRIHDARSLWACDSAGKTGVMNGHDVRSPYYVQLS